jgi:hypothetical protein
MSPLIGIVRVPLYRPGVNVHRRFNASEDCSAMQLFRSADYVWTDKKKAPFRALSSLQTNTEEKLSFNLNTNWAIDLNLRRHKPGPA